uniref:Transcription factor with AP2 domain(S) n=1 Tax=Strongyloides venezuelensis TaxID=75913 RepID=A0A0K0FFA3_STRVS
MECGAYQTPQSSVSCSSSIEMPFNGTNGYFSGSISDNVEISNSTSEMVPYKHSGNEINMFSNYQYNIPCENVESINGRKNSVQPPFSHSSNETCNMEQMGNPQQHFSNEYINNYNQLQGVQDYRIPRNEKIPTNNKLVTSNCDFFESNQNNYCYFCPQESNLSESILNSNHSTNNCPSSFSSTERNISNREIESANYNQFPSILNNIPYNTEKKDSFDIFSTPKTPVSEERYYSSNNSIGCTYYNTAMTATNGNNNFNEDLMQNNNHVNNHTFNPYDEISRKYSYDNFGNPSALNDNSNEEYISNNSTFSFSQSHQQQPQHHAQQQHQLPNLRKGSVYDGMLYRNHNCHGNSINSNVNVDEKYNDGNNLNDKFLQNVTKYDDVNKDNYNSKILSGKYNDLKHQRRMSLQHNLFYGRKDSYGGNKKNYNNEKLHYNQYPYTLLQNTHQKSSEPYYTPPMEVGRGETSYKLYDSIKEKVKKLSIKEKIVSPLSGVGILNIDYDHHQMEEIKEEEEDICITPTFNQSPSVSSNEISKTMKSIGDDNDCQNTFFSSNINNQSNNNYLDINSILPQKNIMIQKRAPFRPRISIMKVSKRKCGWAYEGSNKNTFDVEDFRRQLLKAYEDMKTTNNYNLLKSTSNDVQSKNSSIFDNNITIPDNKDNNELLPSFNSDKPYMNIGIEHQAKIKPWTGKKIKNREEKKESAILLFDPKVISHLTQETVAAYEALACSELMPKGGRNIELALHILYENKGNIQAAVMDLMRIEQLEWDMYPIVNNTKYLLTEYWSKLEMNAFSEAIFKTEKNFNKMSREIGTKTTKQCIEFYYFWKLACPEDYRKLKNLLRKKQLLRKALCKMPIEVYIKIKEKIDNATEEDELPEIEVGDDDEEMPELVASITKNDSIRIEPRKQLETSAKVEIFRPMETISSNTSLDINTSSDNNTLNIEIKKCCMGESIQEPSTSYSWMHSDNACSDITDNITKGQEKNTQTIHPPLTPYHASPATPKKGAQPQADGFFHCRLCDKRFEKVKSLNAHMKSHAMKARAEAEAKSQQSAQQSKQQQPQHILLNEPNINQNILHSQHQQFNPLPTRPLNLTGVFPDTNNITNLFTAANPLASQFQTTHRDLANTLFGQGNSSEPLNPILQSMFPQSLIPNQQTLNLSNEKLLGVLPNNVPFQVSNPYTNTNRNTPTILK